tara:strand:+ start:112 stop:243 length:132 start_codon:yes stop_codon:yes gene_type:complete
MWRIGAKIDMRIKATKIAGVQNVIPWPIVNQADQATMRVAQIP